MSWKDRHNSDASFKDAHFAVRGYSDSFGRIVTVTNIPFSETKFIEDLGEKAEYVTIDAYVSGENYDILRDQLKDALNSSGPGTLIDPYYGERLVRITSASVSEKHDKLRVANFQITYILENSSQGITSITEVDINDLENTTSAIDDLNSSSQALFADIVKIANYPNYVLDSVYDAVSSVLDKIDTFSTPIEDIVQASSDFKRKLYRLKTNLKASFSNLEKLATDISDIFSSMPGVNKNTISLQRDIISIINTDVKVEKLNVVSTPALSVEKTNLKAVEVFAKTQSILSVSSAIITNTIHPISISEIKTEYNSYFENLSKSLEQLEEMLFESDNFVEFSPLEHSLHLVQQSINKSLDNREQLEKKSINLYEPQPSLVTCYKLTGSIHNVDKLIDSNTSDPRNFVGEVIIYEQ